MTILFLQVGLALYLGDMLKTMVGASKKLQAELAMAGHPNAFPSTPKRVFQMCLVCACITRRDGV